MDTEQARELVAAAARTRGKTAGGAVPRPTTVMLRVLAGKTDKTEYVLAGKMSAIGKSEMATVRLAGWFGPDMAATIVQKDDAFWILPAAADAQLVINGNPAPPRHELRSGDVIEMAGVKIVVTLA